jgi:cellulase/cellobiase CelA1
VVTLNPDTRGNMTFRAGSTVTLNPGTFNFASLNIEPDVTVNALGDVRVNVEGALVIGDRSEIAGASANALVLYSNAMQVRIGADANVTGLVIAPGADVSIFSRTLLGGCVGGRNLAIDPDVVIDGSGFNLPTVPPGPPSCDDNKLNGSETDVDCGGPFCDDCMGGQHCASGEDCVSGNCVEGTCDGAGAGSLMASLQVVTDWGGGYCVNLQATNTSTLPTTDWSVLIDTGASTIYDIWNGTSSANMGIIDIAPAFNWNMVIEAGLTNDSIGFCANRIVPGSGVLPVVISGSATF